MRSARIPFHRIALSLLSALGLLLGLTRPAHSEALSPLHLPDPAVGTRCFGYLPCTGIDPFGLRLRLAALAFFRPEKGHERDFYAARLQIVPAITLMKWAELGVAIPITLYRKDIGVTPVYEPLRIYGRVRIPLEEVLGVAMTASGGVRLASGPFSGGLPPDFVAQGAAAYRKQTEVELSLATSKRKGPLSLTAALAAQVAAGHVELSGGAELALHAFKIFEAFVQGQGYGVVVCTPQEAALNFCDRGFRFIAGVRLDGDFGQAGMLIGTGSDTGLTVGAQVGLDYDETTRHRHGDGVEAAQLGWERIFANLRQGWAEWQSAAVMWPEAQVAQHVGPRRPGAFTTLLDGAPPPGSPWLDALLDDAGPESTWIFPEPPSTAGKSPAPKRTSGRRAASHPYARLRQAAAAGQRAQLASVPPFAIHGADPDWMKTEELDRLWRARLEEERQTEAQQWRDSPQLPPFEKAALNWFATAPARAVLGLLAMSGPGRRAEAEEQMRKLRPLKCTPAEEAACDAVEQLLDMTGTMLAPSAAEATVARQAALALARQGAREAGNAAELIAAEQALGLFEEGAEAAQSGPRFVGLLDRLPPRLNPLNYECCGLGSNFGNVKFKPPASRAAAPGSRPFEPFTKAGKEDVWLRNAERHGGTNSCDTCGVEVIKPEKHTKGVTPPSYEGHVDHMTARAKGGSGTPENGQLLCRDCNLEKSDK